MNLPRLPLAGNIDLTYRCNNNCRHCWLWCPENSSVQKDELTYDEIRGIAGEARAMGCRYWYISGGEPLLRPDFPEIFDCLTSKAIGYTLNTNGTLITPEIARLLARRGTKMVALYGADAQVYDHVTRHPGGFEKLIQGMNYLKEAGAGFIVQLIPMRDNYHQWDEMVKLAERFSPHWRMGAPWLYFSADGSSIRNKEIAAQRLKPNQMIELDKRIPFYNELLAGLNTDIDHKVDQRDLEDFNSTPFLESACVTVGYSDDRLFARCIEGRREFHIDPYGQMTWCSYIKDPELLFNLRQGSFEEAWDDFIPSCAVKVRGGKEWREHCGSCSNSNHCRWCAVYAYLETGRYSAPIPYLCAVAEEAERFKQNWNKKHRRYFRIAGITVCLESDIDFEKIKFADELVAFMADGPGDDNLILKHFFELPVFQKEDLGKELSGNPQLRLYRKNATSFYHRYLSTADREEKMSQLAIFSADHCRGTIYSPPHIREEIIKNSWKSLSLFPTDQIWLLPLLTDRSAVLLHSAAAILNNKGIIFVGQSEAGKSTTVELLKAARRDQELEVEILCDEHNIIRNWNNEWRVHGTWHRSSVTEVSASDAPLQGIFFLEQSSENAIITINDRKLIWQWLLAALIRMVDTGDSWNKKLDTMEKMVKEVPCYIMRFDKSGLIVKALEQMTA